MNNFNTFSGLFSSAEEEIIPIAKTDLDLVAVKYDYDVKTKQSSSICSTCFFVGHFISSPPKWCDLWWTIIDHQWETRASLLRLNPLSQESSWGSYYFIIGTKNGV